MTLDPNRSPVVPPPLPTSARVTAGILILIPLVALAIVPVYARQTPRLWGFPFFYWYQFLWVFLASACTWGAYLVITRARGGRP
jgi:hypothetical protein